MKQICLPKIIILFALFSIIIYSCETAKNTQAVNSSFSLEKITLAKSGMMGSASLEITKDQTYIKSLVQGAETETRVDETKPNDWNKLIKFISKLDLNQLETWESPTQARFYDGARATTILISVDSVTYNSQSFDEGKPPAELTELYHYLESLENQ